MFDVSRFFIQTDGQHVDFRDDLNIRQFQAHIHLNRNWGDELSLKVIRNGQHQDVVIALPKQPPS